MTGHHDKYVVYAFYAVTEVRVGCHVVRKSDTGEIANILTVCRHCFEQIEFDNTAEPHVTIRACELKSQRRSPGTRPDDGDRL